MPIKYVSISFEIDEATTILAASEALKSEGLRELVHDRKASTLEPVISFFVLCRTELCFSTSVSAIDLAKANFQRRSCRKSTAIHCISSIKKSQCDFRRGRTGGTGCSAIRFLFSMAESLDTVDSRRLSKEVKLSSESSLIVKIRCSFCFSGPALTGRTIFPAVAVGAALGAGAIDPGVLL